MTRPACRRCGGELRDGVTPKGHRLRWCPACHAKAKRTWRSAHPGAGRAHNIVAKAIAKGVLVREPCIICGDPNTEAHHPDGRYDQPLNIEFRCRTHHRAVHRKARSG